MVRSHEEAPQGGFVYRLRTGVYGAVMPGQLVHSPPSDLNLRRNEEPGPPPGMEGGASEGANLHRQSDYGTRTWPRPGSHPSTSSFTGGRLRVTTLNVRGLTSQDLDKILIWTRDEAVDAVALTDTH